MVSISNYNTYMREVDRNDQLRGYYHARLKSMKYYLIHFFGFCLILPSDIRISCPEITQNSGPKLLRTSKCV